MKIIITGLPGTGKTSIAKELSRKLKIPLYDIKKFTKAKEVDIDLLKSKTKKILTKEDWILEGHLFCEYKINSDFVFLLKKEEKELREIYKKRKYSPEKIEENLFCNDIDYFDKKLSKYYKKIYILKTTKEIKENLGKIIKIIGKTYNK